ncbi:MAG: GspH/FimT family pseudopilin [Deltaproteobacteria bacterium]|nr:GspH/FimT family pseudopilin [Deltaproteobacteria bacterium]
MEKSKWMFNRGQRMNGANGFTLVELMVVIAIIAILSVIAIPNIVVWRENAQLSRATRDLLSDFQLAKIEAIKSNTYCSITFNQTPDGYTIYLDPNQNLQYDTGEGVVTSKTWSDYGSTKFDTSQGGGDGLTFSNPDNGVAFAPNGLPKNNIGGFGAGTAFLTNDRGRKTSVVVSPAGNLRIP